MLRFATKPDRIFVALLTQAIDLALDQFQLDEDPTDQQEALECILPHSATLFDLSTVKAQLVSLRADYHWLLLYEVLQDYCAGFNAMPGGVLTENYGVDWLDFGALVDLFFWDTDFLDSHIPLMPLKARGQMDICPETFGLTAGMRPHPEELVLQRCDEELAKEFDAQEGIVFLPGLTAYPSCADVQAN